jgi:hypothetical protein
MNSMSSAPNAALIAANHCGAGYFSAGLDTFECVNCDDCFLGEVAAVPGEETPPRSLTRQFLVIQIANGTNTLEQIRDTQPTQNQTSLRKTSILERRRFANRINIRSARGAPGTGFEEDGIDHRKATKY